MTGSNINATRENGEPNVSGVSGGKSMWYTWTASASGATTLTTAGSTFDTTLGVFTGSALGDLRLVASNDDENVNAETLTSRLSFNAVAGTTYQILVGGYAGASGNVSLSLSQASRQRSDPSNTAANASVDQTYTAPPANRLVESIHAFVALNEICDLVFAWSRRW